MSQASDERYNQVATRLARIGQLAPRFALEVKEMIEELRRLQRDHDTGGRRGPRAVTLMDPADRPPKRAPAGPALIRQCTVCTEHFEQPRRHGHPYMKCPRCRGERAPDALEESVAP